MKARNDSTHAPVRTETGTTRPLDAPVRKGSEHRTTDAVGIDQRATRQPRTDQSKGKLPDNS